MPERSCPPGTQASQGPALWPAGLASAARRDAGALAQALILAAIELDWPAEISQTCAQRQLWVPLRPRLPAHLALRRRSAESRLRCRTVSSPSLASSWKLSLHSTPQTDVCFTWAALYAPKARIAKHCLLADHLSDRLTLQEINCFSRIVLRFLFIDYYTVCW